MEDNKVGPEYLKSIWNVSPSCIVQLHHLLVTHPELIWLERNGKKINLVYERARLINTDKLFNITSWERGLKHAGLSVFRTTHGGSTRKIWNVPTTKRISAKKVKTSKKRKSIDGDYVDTTGHHLHPVANKKHDNGPNLQEITEPPIFVYSSSPEGLDCVINVHPPEYAEDYQVSCNPPISDEEIIQNIGSGTMYEQAIDRSADLQRHLKMIASGISYIDSFGQLPDPDPNILDMFEESPEDAMTCFVDSVSKIMDVIKLTK